MSTLLSRIDVRSEEYAANRAAMVDRLDRLAAFHAEAVDGGGERYRQRHHDRGRLLARERVERLVDPDSPFLELSATAGAETEFATGGSLITGIGVVAGTECVVLANDPTVKGGSFNPISVRKILRALDICLENRLPMSFSSNLAALIFLTNWRSSCRPVRSSARSRNSPLRRSLRCRWSSGTRPPGVLMCRA